MKLLSSIIFEASVPKRSNKPGLRAMQESVDIVMTMVVVHHVLNLSFMVPTVADIVKNLGSSPEC